MSGMTPNHLTDLALKLDFTAEDLYANRDGILSERQRGKLQRALLRDAILYGVLEVVLVGVVMVMIGGAMRQASEGRLLILVVLLVAASLYPIYIVRQSLATRADLAAGHVEMAAGRVELHDMGRGNFQVFVRLRSFTVSKKVYGAFLNKRHYRVYYAPRLNKILSAEPED
jgi:hypothetical protein